MDTVERKSNLEYALEMKEDKHLRSIINDLDRCFINPMKKQGYANVAKYFGQSLSKKIVKVGYVENFDDSPASTYRKGSNFYIFVNPTLKNGDEKTLRAILLHEMAHIPLYDMPSSYINKNGLKIDNHNGHKGDFDTILKAIKSVYGEKAMINPPNQFDEDEIHVDGNNEVSRKFPKWGHRMGRMEFYQRQYEKGRMSRSEGADSFASDVYNGRHSSTITENYFPY